MRLFFDFQCLDNHMCLDRKSTRLNSSHQIISYAVFCLKKKKNKKHCRYTTQTRRSKRSCLPYPCLYFRSVQPFSSHLFDFFFFFFLMIRRPPRSTLFPYTTSSDLICAHAVVTLRVALRRPLREFSGVRLHMVPG